ncbi:MAG: GWxTD domain-containing protein [bacterium]
MKIKIFLVIILALIINCAVYTQNSQSTQKSNSENIFFESLVFPSNDSPDSNTVYFFYKIRLTELVFDKSDDIKLNSFSAYPTFDIEIKDNSGIIRKRLFKKDTVTMEDYSLLKESDQYYEGIFSTILSSTDYVIRYLVTVNNRAIYDKRISLDNSTKNHLKTIGNPVLVNMLPRENVIYIPAILNNSIDIQSLNPALLAFVNTKDKCNLTTSISYIQESTLPPKDYPLTSNPKVVYLDNKGIDFQESKHRIQGLLKTNLNSSIYQIEIPPNMIYPGKFNISIIDRSIKDTLKYNYQVQWIDKPKSLMNISYAQEIMYYIMTDAEFAELKSAKPKDKENFIYQYWKKFDPTPKTYYNEAMNTYFKRADEAKDKFLTILHNDGAKTSRGQIYILYGNPDSIVTELKEKTPMELWQYKNLKKQFVFEIITPGEYKLTKIIE